MFENSDFIIVGSGWFGCVCAYELSQKGYKVTVLEKRSHIGGNSCDAIDHQTGIRYHLYGPHIFHIDDDRILRYIKKFCSFNSYFHQVLTVHNGETFQLPFNLATINKFFGKSFSPEEAKKFIASQISAEKSSKISNLEDKCVNMIGREMYEAFIKNYTIKQWGKDPSELPPSIIGRIPFRYNYNNCYYNKKYHGIPIGGYRRIFESLLEKSRVILDLDFFDIRDQILPAKKIIYTGPIDKFFNYRFGRLEYRALEFKMERLCVDDFQGLAVMNYADADVPWTRICEPKHFYPEEKNKSGETIIFKEFSKGAADGDPYYPINDLRNQTLYSQYKREADKLENIFFGGRLGEYKYYDMEGCVASALKLADTFR